MIKDTYTLPYEMLDWPSDCAFGDGLWEIMRRDTPEICDRLINESKAFIDAGEYIQFYSVPEYLYEIILIK